MSPAPLRAPLAPPCAEILVRAALVVSFMWLAGRFWHPHHGFTRFLQLDSEAAETMTPALRGAPLHVYRDTGGYDGHYYGQIASDPTLRDPALGGGMDNFSYRARRALLSWVAFGLAGGDRVDAVRIYSWLNLVVWLALAAALWRLLPPGDWRRCAAWAGVLFAAGGLHSVRCALTDLPALLFTLLALAGFERGRFAVAGVWFGLAALTRETSLLAAACAATLLLQQRRWRELPVLVLPAVLPLAGWLLYVRWRLGATGGGWDNFHRPVLGWLGKWLESFRALGTEPDTLLAVSTLLGAIGLTAQAGFMVLRRDRDDAWWRVGAAYAGLMLLLNDGVWEGHPGAAVRVLLPLTLAFNILAARRGAPWGWLLAGNLPMLAGLLTLTHVPRDPHEIAAGRAEGFTYAVRTSDSFYQAEHLAGRTWAWCPGKGTLSADLWPKAPREVRVRVALRAHGDGRAQVRHEGTLLWEGELTSRVREIELPPLPAPSGRLELEVASPVPGKAEHTGPGARTLAFAVHDVELR